MNAKNLIAIIKESGLSPEDFGEIMGVSGMTIRRWTEKPSSEPLPEIYLNAVREAVFKLVIDGRMDGESKLVQQVFQGPGSLSQQAALKAMGFPEDVGGSLEDNHEKIMVGLSHIGSAEWRRQKVEGEIKTLPRYKRMGKEWGRRLSILREVIASKELTAIDKFAAYGALFYLFMTFDLIPDTVPVFGFMDDFAILGIATAYYMSRWKKEQV